MQQAPQYYNSQAQHPVEFYPPPQPVGVNHGLYYDSARDGPKYEQISGNYQVCLTGDLQYTTPEPARGCVQVCDLEEQQVLYNQQIACQEVDPYLTQPDAAWQQQALVANNQ